MMEFSAKLDFLPSMLQWIEDQLTFDLSLFKKVELACEEVLVNIIQHAYKNKSGVIGIQVNIEDGHIAIAISDHGPPFNPLKQKSDSDISLPLEKREVGGLGIYFVLNTLDTVRYKREDSKNTLILVKFY